MFDGGEQLHHFIASPRRSSSSAAASTNSGQLPNFSAFPLLHTTHVAAAASRSSFDSYAHHHQLLLPLHHHHHHFLQPPPLLHHKPPVVLDEKPPHRELAPAEEVNDVDDDRAAPVEPWSNDEVLALLRIRSTMESWFPEFTSWEHVSRKLADLGFKLRSGEKCKEKFEEENRYLFNNINPCTKSFKPFLSELEELYTNTTTTNIPHHNPPLDRHDDDDTVDAPEKTQTLVAPSEPGDEISLGHHHRDEIECSEKEDEVVIKATEEEERIRTSGKKRKRGETGDGPSKFEMFKEFCEEIVNKLMAQQEEMHNKLLEDMVKRDQEKLEKEDLWKKQEMDRMNHELEVMAREQAVAGDRQAAIIEFLKKFTPNNNTTSPNSSSSSDHHSKPNIAASSSSNPNASTLPVNPSSQNPNPSSTWATGENDVGKRWPRDEVLALINLRCSLCSNGDTAEQSAAAKAVPLWERISQGMSEMGFKRSAKRCKEKWENINKYFRKTKDVNKKRSVDSRTCPYFHQLSSLYSKGTLDHRHDLDRVVEGGDDQRLDDHIVSSVGVVPPSFDFEF